MMSAMSELQTLAFFLIQLVTRFLPNINSCG